MGDDRQQSQNGDNVRTLRGDGIVHSCATCAYQEMQPLAMPDGKPIIGKEQMVCKRFPPQVVAMQIPTPAGISVQLMPMFPPVSASMWCFEHKPCDTSQRDTSHCDTSQRVDHGK